MYVIISYKKEIESFYKSKFKQGIKFIFNLIEDSLLQSLQKKWKLKYFLQKVEKITNKDVRT